MARIYSWIEREFHFYLTKGMYLPVVERLRGTPARVEELVLGLTKDQLIQTQSEGSWSIQQNVGHLLSLEILWSTRLQQFIDGASELAAWDSTNSATWEADYNSQAIKTVLADFRETRMLLVSKLDSLDDSLIERTALHPRLKTPMRTIDLAYFVAEHDDYHLAQISRIKRGFKS